MQYKGRGVTAQRGVAYQQEVVHQWGWHVSGGGMSLGGLTFDPYLIDGQQGGGVKQRSHCWWNHWSSNTTSRDFSKTATWWKYTPTTQFKIFFVWHGNNSVDWLGHFPRKQKTRLGRKNSSRSEGFFAERLYKTPATTSVFFLPYTVRQIHECANYICELRHWHRDGKELCGVLSGKVGGPFGFDVWNVACHRKIVLREQQMPLAFNGLCETLKCLYFKKADKSDWKTQISERNSLQSRTQKHKYKHKVPVSHLSLCTYSLHNPE